MSNLVYQRDSKIPIYISNEVGRWLWLLAKAESLRPDDIQPEYQIQTNRITKDEIADQLLRQTIRELHPQLAEHQKKHREA